MIPFSTEVFGKCILAGEHAVLRGIPAIVVPLKSRSLHLSFLAGSGQLKIESPQNESEQTRIVLWGVLEKALSASKKSFSDIEGTISVQNNIPLGAGLGASAALCVAVARFFLHLGWVEKNAVVEFARVLENLFHGESSGVDVAVAERGNTIRYQRGVGISDVIPLWQPSLFLSYSGHKGVTSECVSAVNAFRKANSLLGDEIDLQMKAAVEQIQKSLLLGGISESEREQYLISGIQMGRNCFERWGLTEGNLDNHMRLLEDLGALAVKPTGSGGGGHVLSYWKTPPPKTKKTSFIPLLF